MGKIYSNHLHFLSYLLKCPVDNAGNGKEFGACPQTVIPPTSSRVRTSNFFPLRTYFKVLSYAPERDLSEIILTKTKKTAHTDGYICITEEIFFHFGFIIQVVLFKSKSPFCNWAWAFKEFWWVLFSISFRVCYIKDILKTLYFR